MDMRPLWGILLEHLFLEQIEHKIHKMPQGKREEIVWYLNRVAVLPFEGEALAIEVKQCRKSFQRDFPDQLLSEMDITTLRERNLTRDGFEALNDEELVQILSSPAAVTTLAKEVFHPKNREFFGEWFIIQERLHTAEVTMVAT